MKKIYWGKLSVLEKIAFCLGWLSVFNILFWAIMLLYTFSLQEEKFWSPESLRVVYIFGWINLVALILTIILNIFGL
jgi:hypothetical protein